MRKPYRPASAPKDIGAPICSRFGARLRALRMARGWSQIHVAIDLGIDRSYLSDVERGVKSVSLPMLEVLAVGFKVSLAELLKDV